MNAIKTVIRTVVVVVALMTSAIGTANAAWVLPNGVWVSNVCLAPSGDWAYMQYALPVGSSCRIFATGEFGLVS